MYPNILFCDYINKTNKYNMLLSLFSGVTTCNKYFYVSFVFLHYKDKNFYYWVVSQILELYTCKGQKDGSKVVFTDKKYILITILQEVMPASHHMLYIWHINKNVLGKAKKFFSIAELVKA